jgi:hypothetical protein
VVLRGKGRIACGVYILRQISVPIFRESKSILSDFPSQVEWKNS